MTGPAVLTHERIDRYRPFGAFGKPVYQSHVQLHAMLRSKRGQRFADYFAKPSYEADSGELHWTAHGAGPVRAWRDLAPDEQARQALALEEIRSGLTGFVQELRAQGGSAGGGAAAFASLLEQALRVPAQGDFLYFVGDQPVIAFWGFENQSGASVDPAQTAPLAPPPLPPELLTPEPEPVQPPSPQPTPVPRRRGWWWLLWLLLALLLLAALLWGLRACQQPAAPAMIAIPEGALERSDMSFLEGDWDHKGKNMSTYRDDPDKPTGSYYPMLHFDGKGGGEMHATRRVEHGNPQSDCRAPMATRVEGKRLLIEEGPCLTASGEVAVDGSRMECQRQPDGKTVCHGVNEDGVRWVIELSRMR